MPQYNRENLKEVMWNTTLYTTQLNFVKSQPFTEIKQHDGATRVRPDPYARRFREWAITFQTQNHSSKIQCNF